KGRKAVRRQALYVRRVSDIAKAKPERGDVAVILQDGQELNRASLPLDRDRLAGHQTLFGGNRGILAAGRLHKTITEAGVHRPRCRLIQVDVDAPTLTHEQGPQVVDSVRMVGMLMRDQYAVEPVDFGVEKLHAQIRRTIDQNAGAVAIRINALDKQRATPAAVLRVVRVARTPTESHARHAH